MGINIGNKIGKGMYGSLYEGTDTDLNRKVAVKFFTLSVGDEQFRKRQAKAAADANHPNVVTIYSFQQLTNPSTEKLEDAIVMEFCEGVTLAALVNRAPFSRQEGKRIGDAIISAITYLHRDNIFHGDMHAENVMVSSSTVKLIDFLSYDSVAQMSTRSKDTQVMQDIVQLKGLLDLTLQRSEVDFNARVEFSKLSFHSTLDEIKVAFDKVFEQPAERTAVQTAARPSSGQSHDERQVLRVKRYLPNEQEKIRLNDLLYSEFTSLKSELASPQFAVDSPQPDTATIPERAAKYEAATIPYAKLLACVSAWGTDEQLKYLDATFSELSKAELPPGTSFKAWTSMRLYPNILCFYFSGFAAMVSENYGAMRRLYKEVQIQTKGVPQPLLATTHLYRVMTGDVAKLLPGLANHVTPLSEHLFSLMRLPIESLKLFGAVDYTRAFDQFELLTALVYCASMDGSNPPLGRFGAQIANWGKETALNELRMPVSIAKESPLIKNGLFKSPEQYSEALERVIVLCDQRFF
jgi:Protein kinase domain